MGLKDDLKFISVGVNRQREEKRLAEAAERREKNQTSSREFHDKIVRKFSKDALKAAKNGFCGVKYFLPSGFEGHGLLTRHFKKEGYKVEYKEEYDVGLGRYIPYVYISW